MLRGFSPASRALLSPRLASRASVLEPSCFALFCLPSSSSRLPACSSPSPSVFSRALRLQPWLSSHLSSVFTVFRVQRLFFRFHTHAILCYFPTPPFPPRPATAGARPAKQVIGPCGSVAVLFSDLPLYHPSLLASACLRLGKHVYRCVRISLTLHSIACALADMILNPSFLSLSAEFSADHTN
ncbi:hypothetical protein FB451DRAFT_639663 [Mycena latifolia]|nr:hypothetical protein FB451DRAFT_639663 [Mycena latifolia]